LHQIALSQKAIRFSLLRLLLLLLLSIQHSRLNVPRTCGSKKEVPRCSSVKSYFICNVAAPHIFLISSFPFFGLLLKNSSHPVAIMTALVSFDYNFLPAQYFSFDQL
jgi:hypothetical protein